MITALMAILTPIMVVAVWAFLIYRFGFFASREVGGRGSFLTGGILLFVATAWEIVELASGYDEWFVSSAYAAVNFGQYLFGAVGLLLAVVGLALYSDYWQVQREDIQERFSKLAILENLHHDSRQPYHLLELLNISLREILVHYPMAAGTILLINRSRRQFVLTGSSGLRKEEVASLEYYPLERNLLSQALELGDPVITSSFEFVERTGHLVPSRFKSVLIMPLTTGLKKIGCLVLFSEEETFFGREDTRYLAPVAQWLAEKINTGRLEREFNRAEKARERAVQQFDDFATRLVQTSRTLTAPDPADAFCRSLVGLAGSESVHLVSAEQGDLEFIGGSEPLLNLTESYRAAVTEGLGRGKPLAINQEAQDNGQSRLVQSTLIYPLGPKQTQAAVLLVRSEQAFTLDDLQRRQLDAMTAMGSLLLRLEETRRAGMSRRRGFDALLGLIQREPSGHGSEDVVNAFCAGIMPALPRETICLGFRPGAETGEWELIHPEIELNFSSEEAGLESSLARGKTMTVSGRGEVRRYLEQFHDQTRSSLRQAFGERGLPDLLTFCPLRAGAEVNAIVLVALYGVTDQDRDEYDRLLRLAADLCSLRWSIDRVPDMAVAGGEEEPPTSISGDHLNEINNLLSGVIGSAELLQRGESFDEEHKLQLATIIDRTEEVGRLVSKAVRAIQPEPAGRATDGDRLKSLITDELARHRLSGNLHMVGQRPREVRLRTEPTGSPAVDDEPLRKLFDSVVNRFSILAAEDEAITIATYQKGDRVYLDLSRHRPNFPAVDRVADFGRYMPIAEGLRRRPQDVFLRHLEDQSGEYAFDSGSPEPAYLSFKFPLAAVRPESRPYIPSQGKMLAIDDQQVILDLIVAVGRQLGYEVDTASTAETGLDLAQQNAYRLVLTDLALPGMSGLQAAERIKLLQPNVPIVLVTGWSTGTSESELHAAGIVEVLQKPFRMEQLTAVVQNMIERRA